MCVLKHLQARLYVGEVCVCVYVYVCVCAMFVSMFVCVNVSVHDCIVMLNIRLFGSL